MRSVYLRRVLTGLFLVIFLAISSIGCPGPEKPDSDEPDQGVSTDQNDSGETEPAVEDESAEQPADDPTAQWLRENIGTREQLTQEEIENLTTYGAIMFPDAVLNAETSIHQKHTEGTEIYRLGFDVATSINTVTDWYRDHLESGAEEDSAELAAGRSLVHFGYEDPEGIWSKIISITGYDRADSCQITVEIINKSPVPDEVDEETSSSSDE